MPQKRVPWSIVRWAGVVCCAGCGLDVPDSVTNPVVPQRTPIEQKQGVRFFAESNLDDAVWMQVPRARQPGMVAGYLSTNQPDRGALVILVHGASFYTPDGSAGTARQLHFELGRVLQRQGYVTWSLAQRECGGPYGQDDLSDVLEAVDWAGQTGKEMLGVSRTYLVGYSNGGALAAMVNRRRPLGAVVSLAGFVHPAQLGLIEFLNPWMRQFYPDNVGTCQVIDTFQAYGPLDSPAWRRFDVSAHLEEMNAPMLFVQGTDDFVFPAEFTRILEGDYRDGVSAGKKWPALYFAYVPDTAHQDLPASPQAAEHIVRFLNDVEAGRISGSSRK